MKGAALYAEKGVWLADGSRGKTLYDAWQASGNSATKRELDRLSEYCDKAAACFYRADQIAMLRKEYSDVV